MTTFTTNTQAAVSATESFKPALIRAVAALRNALTPARRDPQAMLEAQARRAEARRAVDNLLR